MPLDPKDDYPDSMDRLTDDQVRKGARPVDFKAEMKRSSKALRAWVDASPRRSLSPNGRLIALGRNVAYEKEWATAPLLPILRPVRKGDYALWSISVQGEGPDGRPRWAATVLPPGVAVQKVAIADDATITAALVLDAAVAAKLGTSPRVEASAPFEAWKKLPASPTQAEKREGLDALAAIFAGAGIGGTGVKKGERATREKEARAAKKAAAAAERPAPTAKEYRAFVVERLEKLRPALVADLRRRVFPYPFPPGTKELAFELFFLGLDEEMLVGYLMDGNNGQVMVAGEGGTRVLAPNLQVLPKKQPLVPRRTLERFDALEDGVEIHVPLVRRWFIEAWKEAGGRERFPLPASIQYHDGGKLTKLPSRS